MRSGCAGLTVVDVSADFRYADADAYAAVYGQPHGAPQLLDQFASAVPEHLASTDKPHIGHPGCFATALLDRGRAADETRPDGSRPVCLRHHGQHRFGQHAGGGHASPGTPVKPVRLQALEATGTHPRSAASARRSPAGTPALHFVPHSGPFARGIHMTVQAKLTDNQSADDIRNALHDFYAGCEFISVRDGTPKIKNIVGSNYCHIGVAAEDGTVAVFVVDRQSRQGCGRWSRAMDESKTWFRRDDRADRTGTCMDLTR